MRIGRVCGIPYIVVFDEHSDAFAPIVARLAGTYCVLAS